MQSFHIIAKMINCLSLFPDEVRNKNNLHSLMQLVIKQLLMNEIEIIYYSLYLEHYSFSKSNLSLINHLLIIGLNVKVILLIYMKLLIEIPQ